MDIPFPAYLIRGELPDDITEERRIKRRSKVYTIINGELYKRSISGMFQRCIALEDGQALLRDIHAGICTDPSWPKLSERASTGPQHSKTLKT